MDDYFVMHAVALEWKTATEELRESMQAAVGKGLRPAIARHRLAAGLGGALVFLTALLLWMIL